MSAVIRGGAGGPFSVWGVRCNGCLTEKNWYVEPGELSGKKVGTVYKNVLHLVVVDNWVLGDSPEGLDVLCPACAGGK